jgi:hypothetical protein
LIRNQSSIEPQFTTIPLRKQQMSESIVQARIKKLISPPIHGEKPQAFSGIGSGWI